MNTELCLDETEPFVKVKISCASTFAMCRAFIGKRNFVLLLKEKAKELVTPSTEGNSEMEEFGLPLVPLSFTAHTQSINKTS